MLIPTMTPGVAKRRSECLKLSENRCNTRVPNFAIAVNTFHSKDQKAPVLHVQGSGIFPQNRVRRQRTALLHERSATALLNQRQEIETVTAKAVTTSTTIVNPGVGTSATVSPPKKTNSRPGIHETPC